MNTIREFTENTTVISFDCYGTLIDWKTGVLEALRPLLDDYHLDIPDEELFLLFAKADRHFITGTYMPYRQVLEESMKWIAGQLGVNLHPGDTGTLVNSLSQWPPFPDTLESLKRLKKRYRLAVISNIDDGLFNLTRERLGIDFDWVITAFQVQSYKPASPPFREALDRFGVPKTQVLHLAQSLFHDIRPCLETGIPHAWINRYHEPDPGQPDPVPDFTFSSLEEMAASIF